jgi:hypothetical protein
VSLLRRAAQPIPQRLKPLSLCCINVATQATTCQDFYLFTQGNGKGLDRKVAAADSTAPNPEKLGASTSLAASGALKGAATKAKHLRREEELFQLIEVGVCGV